MGFMQCAIFPVRYPDFDKGVVEDLVKPFIENDSVDMIMSLSLNGGLYYFDLERFAAKKRGGSSDNMNIRSGTANFNPDMGSVDEFYQTTLPTDKIITPLITNNFNLNLQKYFYDQSYETSNGSRRRHPSGDDTQPNTNSDSFDISKIQGSLTSGSGGSYLSNEIFYRIARIRELHTSSIKTGHYHLANPNGSLPRAIKNRNPRIESVVTPSTYSNFTLIEILDEVENALKRSLNVL